MTQQSVPGLRPSCLPADAGLARRCLVMGVVNVTPDSFSDGGAYLDVDAAIRRGLELLADGADIIDVGGESTRPGAGRVSPAEERRRVLPVVRELAGSGAVVSVDTTRAALAEECLRAGALLVNDVSGGTADPAMAGVVAASAATYVLMHGRGPSADMASRASYREVVAEVRAELGERLDTVIAAGVQPEQVVLDPGFGFAKRPEHNWALLAGLDRLRTLGRPVLVGASRKSFLGALLAAADGTPRPPSGREAATVAVSTLAAAAGAWCVRVHDVAGTLDAVRVVEAFSRAGAP